VGKSTKKASSKSFSKTLSRADEILLIAILVLGQDAYSTTIRSELLVRAKKKVTVGSLWVSLDQLFLRGYIHKQPVKNEQQLGGRPRIFYRLTPSGIDQLKRIQQFQQQVWLNVPVLDSYEI
jgi:PadR family transcriptional regulator, regulatory protein PadR